MSDKSFLQWPFFDAAHRALAEEIDAFATDRFGDDGFVDHDDIDKECASIAADLAAGGWLRHCTPAAYGGAADSLDVRALCLIRETLARRSGLADFVFAMQGLGSGPITIAGDDAQKQAYLPDVAAGQKIAAFALTEPASGSDVANLQTRAEADGSAYLLNGEKTYISNGGIADFYIVFARTGGRPGAKSLSAFIVHADAPGLVIAERIETMAPHPLATIEFNDCRIGADKRLGAEGEGFKIAMATLDIFRSTVGAAALGFARRALDEATQRALSRQLFGGALAELQLTQTMLGEMALDIDAAALLIYRAAWAKAAGGAERVTREAAMAKLYATDRAQIVIDKAVQLFGGAGVRKGSVVEALYREIRALRIYEGASEVQKLVIARQILSYAADDSTAET